MNSAAQALPITVTDQPKLIGMSAHIHASCSSEQLERINSSLRQVGKKDLSQKKQSFTWMVRSQGVNWEHALDLFVEEEETAEFLLVLDLVATHSQSESRARSSERRLRQVAVALNAVIHESLIATVNCVLSWHYQADECELPVSLPLGLAVATTGQLRSVKGVRITSDDGETWVVFDLSNSAPNFLHVGSGYTFDTPLNERVLDTTIEYGQSLIAQVGFAYRGKR